MTLRITIVPALFLALGVGASAQEVPTIRAVRLVAPLVIDGKLEDEAWRAAPVFSQFVQQVPSPGSRATQRTEVQVLYDDEALYVGVRAYQSAGVPVIANELRRDAGQMHRRNDSFTVALDTFFDRRNGYLFIFNPLGAVEDWACWDEGRVWSQEWNTVWDVKTSVETWGWAAELRLPFHSLRFKNAGPQQWGINFRRGVLAKNEWSFATAIPPEWEDRGIGKFSSAAVLLGVEVPRRTLNVEFNPYALGGVVQPDCGASGCTSDPAHQAGVDLKYGITSNLTFDATYNTDFSQVEADEQQINFTRFSLFFPEKRQFFLEGKGIFDVGITSGDYRVLPFFSRRIGLEGSQTVPILGGARLTGKAGAYSIGALGLHTGARAGVADSTFSVLRVKRDVLRRSSVGFLVADRRTRGQPNDAFAADANFAFGRSAKVESFLARAWSPGREADSWAGRFHAVNDGDRYAAEADYVRVGKNFDPQIGYVRRRDVNRWYGRVQTSPRLKRGPVRKAFAALSLDYARDGGGRLESRQAGALFKLEFHSGDIAQFTATRTFDSPDVPFRVGGLLVPAGSYVSNQYVGSWDVAKSRRAAGRIEYHDGGYYGGSRRGVTLSGILKADAHFYADINYRVDRLRLSAENALTHLIGTRLNYSATTTVYSSALLQWNSTAREFDTNIRLDWIYRPGSNLYVVYGRVSDALVVPAGLRNQSFVVKVTRLLQF